MFKELQNESFDEREKRILNFWNESKIYQKSLEERNSAEKFIFYDGPPFATGLPHYGHLLAGTIKDVVCRYKSMKGYHVPRKLGWDCHGLPVEQEIEKQENLSGAKSIEEFGIANFNEACRSIVLRYTTEWERTISRMGRWVDFEKPYHTMDKEFMESVWWVCKELFDKGLVYEGFKVMPFSAKLGTPLSNFEASENYKDVDDPSLYVSFPLVDDECAFIAWTTTPWTLISNQVLMVGPEIDYVKIKVQEKSYILAEARVGDLFEEFEVLERMKGSELAGTSYVPPFDYFEQMRKDGSFKVIVEREVSTEDGTGIVHAAPAFGELDFNACKAIGIEPVIPVDTNGKFTAPITEYVGLFVKDADKDIIKRLKASGRLIKQATIHHRYPFCWRSDTPLIYRAMRTWFVSVEKIKDKVINANEQVHWMPEYIKHGRFGKWLEGARDWAISRNRYWGTPIPLWRSEDDDIICVGSVEELYELSGVRIDDLHRHFIDDIEIVKDGKTYRRIPEVFDCWFESGSMPYAQAHYPFENKQEFEDNFPADFIAEGLDQTRGWFYTLTVLSAALFDKPAFKNVIVNGIILAEDGNKMSKRLKNYPDPEIVISKYGADAIRLYMLDSPAAKASDLRFTERGVELVLRQMMIPLWNAYSFFITYARLGDFKPKEGEFNPKDTMDQWILSKLQHLIAQVESGLDKYDLPTAVKPFVGFIDQLTNWYIRRCRRRFWEEKPTADRTEAFQTLYHVLLELSKVAAPFVPFISDAIYSNLRTDTMAESVHLADYPQYNSKLRDEHLEEVMEAIQQAVSIGHALRKEHRQKVRQPLPKVIVASSDSKILGFLQEQKRLFLDEINVKELELTENEEELVKLIAKPNFRSLGKRLGSKMNLAQKLIGEFTKEQLQTILNGGSVTLDMEGEEFTLTPDDILVDRKVREGLIAKNSGHLTVALDTSLNEDLLIEGLAREVVNKVNSMRRDLDFNVSDRIEMTLETTDRVKKAFDVHGDYIAKEVLALKVEFASCDGTEWDLNGEKTRISLIRR